MQNERNDQQNQLQEPNASQSATATVRQMLEAWWTESDLVAQEIAFCREFHCCGECEYCNDPDYRSA